MTARMLPDRLKAMLLAFMAFVQDRAPDEWADSRLGRAAQAGRLITVVVLAVVAIVGILIYSEIDSALGTPSNNDLANAQTNVTDGFASAMELVPVVLIVLVAALVIGVVSRLRR